MRWKNDGGESQAELSGASARAQASVAGNEALPLHESMAARIVAPKDPQTFAARAVMLAVTMETGKLETFRRAFFVAFGEAVSTLRIERDPKDRKRIKAFVRLPPSKLEEAMTLAIQVLPEGEIGHAKALR
jgi:hypothetical protein